MDLTNRTADARGAGVADATETAFEAVRTEAQPTDTPSSSATKSFTDKGNLTARGLIL
jgi:hypothetical protein